MLFSIWSELFLIYQAQLMLVYVVFQVVFAVKLLEYQILRDNQTLNSPLFIL